LPTSRESLSETFVHIGNAGCSTLDGLAAQTVAALQAGAHFRPGAHHAQDLVKQVVVGRLRAALEHRLAMPAVTSLEARGF
jgi:hypothetical protein